MPQTYNPSDQPLYRSGQFPRSIGKLPLRPLVKRQHKPDHHPEAAGQRHPTAQAATAAKKHQTRQELKQAIGDAGEVLAKAKTVFPFTLFPDTITLDRSNLTISHKTFFQVGEVTTIRIHDVLNTIANIGPFFASLKITTRFFGEDKVYEIHYLHREDALKIKRILQGYIVALQKDIDCSSLSTKELSKLLDELGSQVT